MVGYARLLGAIRTNLYITIAIIKITERLKFGEPPAITLSFINFLAFFNQKSISCYGTMCLSLLIVFVRLGGWVGGWVATHSVLIRTLIKLKGIAKLTAQGERVCLKHSKYILFEILAHRTWKGRTSSCRRSKPDLGIWLAWPA